MRLTRVAPGCKLGADSSDWDQTSTEAGVDKIVCRTGV